MTPFAEGQNIILLMMKNSSISQNQKETFRHKFRNDLPWLCFMGVIFASAGWIIENTAKLIGSGQIDCRFHLLPFISPYSLIPFALYSVLGNPNHLTCFGKPLFKTKTRKTVFLSNLLSFLFIAFTVFFGELLVGNLWDCLFGVELWNYDNHVTRVTKYTSLRSAFSFGIGGYLIFKLIFSPMLNFFKRKIPRKIAKIVGCTLLLIILLDTVFMGIHIAVFRRAPMYWTVRFR